MYKPILGLPTFSVNYWRPVETTAVVSQQLFRKYSKLAVSSLLDFVLMTFADVRRAHMYLLSKRDDKVYWNNDLSAFRVILDITSQPTVELKSQVFYTRQSLGSMYVILIVL